MSRDLRLTTAKNLKFIATLSGQNPWSAPLQLIKDNLVKTEQVQVCDHDQWRVNYLWSFLKQYEEALAMLQESNMETIASLIYSLARN